MTKGFWKHSSCIDAYIYIKRIQYNGPKYWKVKLEWWVRGTFIRIQGVYKIMKSERHFWKHCNSEGKL